MSVCLVAVLRICATHCPVTIDSIRVDGYALVSHVLHICRLQVPEYKFMDGGKKLLIG